MSANPFAAVLSQQLATHEQSHESLVILQHFCRGVELSTNNRVQCALERGNVAAYGQEWRPVVRSSSGGPPQLLFRAYIPLDGWPVQLDLHEGPLTRCANSEELTQALQDFLRDPNVVTQIRYIMASQQDLAVTADTAPR